MYGAPGGNPGGRVNTASIRSVTYCRRCCRRAVPSSGRSSPESCAPIRGTRADVWRTRAWTSRGKSQTSWRRLSSTSREISAYACARSSAIGRNVCEKAGRHPRNWRRRKQTVMRFLTCGRDTEPNGPRGRTPLRIRCPDCSSSQTIWIIWRNTACAKSVMCPKISMWRGQSGPSPKSGCRATP